ncbi:hypothetical protein K490DRAFT_71985 [Saccharata proteae CBS 121410]|uniref:Uncharacterized protein n=1 Tax=Saccharata proteae CBS 121410 TaxID=1314787 RepID=A0A9P4LXA8_9PEZI|nr:hypothetical protein K490DRAFT_71985 [Saccharata proteae CBS 121410]
MADNEAVHRFLSKSKWRNKLGKGEEAVADKAEKKKLMEQDVVDFLKPSTNKFTPPRAPRIDVAAAQRWPGASDVLKANATPPSEAQLSSSVPSSMRGSHQQTGRRRAQTLAVGFQQSAPEVIGEGGDESDVPVIEISRRRVAAARAARDSRRANGEQPTGGVERSASINPGTRPEKSGESFQMPALQRAQTSFGEMSPPLQKRFQSSPRARSPPPAQAPQTDDEEEQQSVEGAPAGRRREDSAASKSIEDPDDFRPGPLKRTPTNFSVAAPESDDEAPQLPELERFASEESDLPMNEELSRFLEAGPFELHLPPPQPASLPRLTTQSQPQPMRSPAISTTQKTPSPTDATPGPRPDVTVAGNAAFADFGERVTHIRGIFRLTAEMEKPIFSYTPMQWLRACCWWFLKGRAGLEILIRNRPKGATQEDQHLTQAHVDLAKAWWILTEIIYEHPNVRKFGNPSLSQAELARQAGDQEMADIWDIHESFTASLKGLLVSVSRNQVMPPDQSLIQGQDQSIWVKYPTFTPDVATVLAGKSRSLVVDGPAHAVNPRSIMPSNDTKDDFCYGRMFVSVSVTTEEVETDRVPIPCVATILRPRNDWQVKLAICSQSELLTVIVQGNPKLGLTWDSVRWKTKTRGMYVALPRGFTLSLDLSEKDYRQLWGIYDYTRRVEASLHSKPDERLLHEVTLREFHYSNPEDPQAFPNERVRRCRVRVFEKAVVRNEGVGQRRLHRGYRLLIVTSPKSKTLSSVSHELVGKRPLLFDFRADPSDERVPAMVLAIKEDKKKLCTAFMTFNDPKERVQLFHFLNGLSMSSDEMCWAQIPLKGFTIDQVGMKELYSQGHSIVKKLQWQDVKVLNKDPENASSDVAQTVLSENLRIVARHSCGSVTDRVNLGPGEQLIRLDNSGQPDLHVLRLPQDDATAAVDAKRAENNIPDAIGDLLRTFNTSSTVRTYSFHNMKDMHAFEAALTGFNVKYDGVASSFAITRRRAVVPIHKRLEASYVRVQIIQQESVVQLLAFFEDFSHASSMNFQLKSMDVFEKVDLKGKEARFGLKLVDAKFALKKEKKRDSEGMAGRDELERMKKRFACLDMPDYPGEHEDITVGFENEADRDAFAEALPAATQMSRLVSFKRKI